MANLLELAQIDEWSRSNPEDDVGSPPNPDIAMARQLRARMRMLLIRKAYAYIQATPNPDGQDQLEMLAFAQQVLRNPNSHLETAFNLSIAQAGPAVTVSQILNASDVALDNILSGQILRLIARGLNPGSR